jgi:hypothetical protein
MTADEKHNDTEYAPRFKSMTAEKKLRLSLNLYYASRELKRAWLKLQHPEWDNAAVEEELKEVFKHAGT